MKPQSENSGKKNVSYNKHRLYNRKMQCFTYTLPSGLKLF